MGFSTFCDFRGVYRLHATDLSQLPFLRCGFSNSFTGSVQEVVQWMCRRVASKTSYPTRRRSCETFTARRIPESTLKAGLKVVKGCGLDERSEEEGEVWRGSGPAGGDSGKHAFNVIEGCGKAEA